MSHKVSKEEITLPVIQRFIEKTQELSNGCWIWTAQYRRVKGKRYPRFSVSGIPRNALVVAWYMNHDEEPFRFLSNACGDPRCVSPYHVTTFAANEAFRRCMAPPLVKGFDPRRHTR